MTVPLFATKPRLALLDWDGTFCDSRESIYEINLIMAKHYGKTMPSYEDWLAIAHPGVEPCMRSLGVTEDRKAINAFFHKLLTEQRGRGFQNPLYPGTHNLLQCFEELGIPAIIISRHLHDHLVLDIEAHGLSKYFYRIIGEPEGADLIKKEVIRQICVEFGVGRRQAFYLGDTVHDMKAARHARVIAGAISHGYDPRARLQKKGRPNLTIDSLPEFQAVLA